MHVRIVVTTSDGTVLEGTAVLAVAQGSPASRRLKPAKGRAPSLPAMDVDFAQPLRPNMKRLGKGLSGSRKFTVLLALLLGGQLGKERSLKDIEKAWNRMKLLMEGKFNPAHTTRAKDAGWVDTPRPGYYVLLPNWTKSLSRGRRGRP